MPKLGYLLPSRERIMEGRDLRPDTVRKRQMCFAGEPEPQLEALVRMRAELGW